MDPLLPENVEDIHDTVDSLDTWVLFASGSLAATLTAALLSGWLEPQYTWPILFLQAIGYIALTVTAGVAGMSIPWFFFAAKSSFHPRLSLARVAVGWIFLPCILLLYRQQSRWMFLVVALATVPVAFSLRRLLPLPVEQHQIDVPNQQSSLPTLNGLPILDFQPLRAFFIALCAQAALLSAIAGYLLLAGSLLSLSLFLLVWRWMAFDTTVHRRFTGRKPSILFSALALFFTVLVLTPAISRELRGASAPSNPVLKPSPVVHPTQSGKPTYDYVGVVLWPPPKKKTEIIPPPPPATSARLGAAAKPVVIPFDGPYWYFKAPSKKPGPHAHIAHGNSTDVNVRSDDWAPLLMEAHQDLGSSIDLRYCSEIDVALTNADDRPGTIAVGVLLADSNSPGKPFQYLSEQPIVSSEASQIPLNRPPVQEILRFPISRSAALHHFNEITIAFLPAKERARGGSKVSIQSFTLIPR